MFLPKTSRHYTSGSFIQLNLKCLKFCFMVQRAFHICSISLYVPMHWKKSDISIPMHWKKSDISIPIHWKKSDIQLRKFSLASLNSLIPFISTFKVACWMAFRAVDCLLIGVVSTVISTITSLPVRDTSVVRLALPPSLFTGAIT